MDFFLNINRYRKKSVGYPIHFFEYPYDNKWKVESSKSSWRQNWVHFLITRRNKTNSHRSDIKKELQKIKFKTIYFIIIENTEEFKKYLKSILSKIKKNFFLKRN
jgi:hypothetical protein